MNDNDIVFVSFARTPIGAFQGQFNSLSCAELGAVAIQGAVERSGISSDQIEEVVMGNVLMAGQGQAPARQATLGAGLNQSTITTTVNRMCGSGMQSVFIAHAMLQAGAAKVMVAGGMESMTNAPYLLPKARGGYRMGHGKTIDSMFYDGLEDAYARGTLMGVFAENTSEKYSFSREQQDDFAINSLKKAQQAINEGYMTEEIVAVEVKGRKSTDTYTQDELPLTAKLDKIPKLKPAFRDNGTVTPANSSAISDGAAALVMMTCKTAKELGLTPVGRVAGISRFAHQPEWFTTAPVGALQQLFDNGPWGKDEVELFEINEAFACVTMAAVADFNLNEQIVNVNGGACALGHPIGATGARIICTLLGALARLGKTKGVAALCIGGGEAAAIAVERLN